MELGRMPGCTHVCRVWVSYVCCNRVCVGVTSFACVRAVPLSICGNSNTTDRSWLLTIGLKRLAYPSALNGQATGIKMNGQCRRKHLSIGRGVCCVRGEKRPGPTRGGPDVSPSSLGASRRGNRRKALCSFRSVTHPPPSPEMRGYTYLFVLYIDLPHSLYHVSPG